MTHNFEQAPYARHLARDRRLVILRVLADSAGYQANEYILETMLEELGHVVGSDLLHGELAWLAEQDLLTQQRVAAIDRKSTRLTPVTYVSRMPSSA